MPRVVHVEPVEVVRREIALGERFDFGRNWRRFLALLNEQRIAGAEQSLREMLGGDALRGARFLDVGSGSGLFSLAARRLGASVLSFDYDPSSVACTEEIRRRFFPDDAEWTIRRGSILDREFIRSLGVFDVVYAWGVLHHTGNLRLALEIVADTVAARGRLFLAVYNDQGIRSVLWRQVKRAYCSSTVARWLIAALFLPYFVLGGLVADLARRKNPLDRYRAAGTPRGMSRIRDWSDWLGGLPFEVAKPEVICEFFDRRGFRLKRLTTCGGRPGCNEFVFVKDRPAEPAA
ncbi:MAG: class I SAM-dependent methyltransferase [Deltaproteobacteria bacterium]|nr:class I SAM-dependent methyltransferase [Deltaproteobacteria bacterium]